MKKMTLILFTMPCTLQQSVKFMPKECGSQLKRLGKRKLQRIFVVRENGYQDACLMIGKNVVMI